MIKQFDITLLTQREYLHPMKDHGYIDQVLLEDRLLTEALESKGLRVARVSWDDPHFNWLDTHFALFRATWDYFRRIDEFRSWLEKTKSLVEFINPYPIIKDNMDKHYLQRLMDRGVNIPPTVFVEQGAELDLQGLIAREGWTRAILKPAVAGGAHHTYLFDQSNLGEIQSIFQQLIKNQSFLVQAFQEQITTRGEVSFMVFGGQYSHAVLKKAREGDFRVQDDFGGSVHPYMASEEEKRFVEFVISQCVAQPVYARVDVMWDNQNRLCLSELEMIEPELWFRTSEQSAFAVAEAVCLYVANKISL
jgi:glutathione synthase/RimK-type ligase-like ATP-grasp enzyme